ncbi:MAG TPA: hypothetical protein VK640_03000 [Actinomycetes bacterium]|nr:hypothetical protein [Actinomycetes bacterium]
MSALDHYDYHPLQVAKDGSLVDRDQVRALRRLADESTDVLVLAHGWNNDMEEAHALYERIATRLDDVRGRPDAGGSDRSVAICGVLWPSKRFAERSLISGGAAAAGAADPHLSEDVLDLASAFDGVEAEAALKEAADLAPELERSAQARRRYADLLRSLVTREESEPSDAIDQFFDLDGDELMDRIEAAALDLMTEMPPPEETGATAANGSADGLGLGAGFGSAQGLLGGLASKGRMLLNLVTYYEMKNRAGTIGAGTVGPALADNVVGRARIHLAGHSFGGRLVTAAASVQQPGAVASLSLLQAAFSHNAFAQDWKPGRDGAYRSLVTSGIVDGPVVITHTRHDVAVGIAYAMASRIAGQQDSAIGDASSTYGGLGSNGAQHTPEAVDGRLRKVGSTYDLGAGSLHNLLADEFVSGHSDVSGPEVAAAVWQAVLAGGAPREP